MVTLLGALKASAPKIWRSAHHHIDQTVAGTSPFQAAALVGVPIGLPA